jgi:hypothetical protein
VWVCSCSLAGIVGSNTAGNTDTVSFECRVLSGRSLCVGLITRPGEFYQVWCVEWVRLRNPVRGGRDPQ